MIRAAIFDMDGLLIDSEPFWRKAEISAFAEVGLILSEADCRETMGYRIDEVVDLWFRRRPWQQMDKKQVIQTILTKITAFIRHEGKPLPGAVELVKACKNAGLKTAIASSSPSELIREVVKKFELGSWLDLVHSAEYEPYGKPHPGVFITTAIVLGVNPEECLVFEDSFHGMIAGLAAKMRTVVVPETASFKSEKFNVASLKVKSLADVQLTELLNA